MTPTPTPTTYAYTLLMFCSRALLAAAAECCSLPFEKLTNSVKPYSHHLVVLTKTRPRDWSDKASSLIIDGDESASIEFRAHTAPLFAALVALTARRSTAISTPAGSPMGGAKVTLASIHQAVLGNCCNYNLKADDVLLFSPNRTPIALRDVSVDAASEVAAFVAAHAAHSSPRFGHGGAQWPALHSIPARAQRPFPFTSHPLVTPARLPSTHILVCCHTQRDVRCGEHGHAILAAMRAAIDEGRRECTADRFAADVWTSLTAFGVSHIGGHEFAANVLFYPTGDWFGLLRTPHEVREVIRAYVRTAAAAAASAATAASPASTGTAPTPNVPFDFGPRFESELPRALRKHWRSRVCGTCGEN